MAWLGVVACALVAGILIGRTTSQRTDVRPEVVRVEGRVIEGRDRANRVAWRTDLGEVVRPLKSSIPALGEYAGSDSVASVDLDADGALEFIVPVRIGTSQAPSVTDRLIAVGAAGRVKCSAAPDCSVECGGRTFDGPWQLRAFVTSPGPGPARVWASYSDSIEWPSFVVEFDAKADMSGLRQGDCRPTASGRSRTR